MIYMDYAETVRQLGTPVPKPDRDPWECGKRLHKACTCVLVTHHEGPCSCVTHPPAAPMCAEGCGLAAESGDIYCTGCRSAIGP